MLELSILMGGIRPSNWLKLYESIFTSTRRNFELIFVGPYDLPKELQNNNRVRFIQDFGQPSRCYQIGVVESKADYILWGADDGYFLPNNSVDGAMDILNNLGNRKKDIISLKYYEGKISKVRRKDEFWMVKSHPTMLTSYIPPNFYLIMNGLMRKDYFIEVGGWDCSFESHAMATCDFAMRVQRDKANVTLYKEPFLHVEHSPGKSGDHGPLHCAHLEHDEPLFKEIYSNKNSLNRVKIDFDNWKDTPSTWHRRFK